MTTRVETPRHVTIVTGITTEKEEWVDLFSSRNSEPIFFFFFSMIFSVSFISNQFHCSSLLFISFSSLNFIKIYLFSFLSYLSFLF